MLFQGRTQKVTDQLRRSLKYICSVGKKCSKILRMFEHKSWKTPPYLKKLYYSEKESWLNSIFVYIVLFVWFGPVRRDKSTKLPQMTLINCLYMFMFFDTRHSFKYTVNVRVNIKKMVLKHSETVKTFEHSEQTAN